MPLFLISRFSTYLSSSTCFLSKSSISFCFLKSRSSLFLITSFWSFPFSCASPSLTSVSCLTLLVICNLWTVSSSSLAVSPSYSFSLSYCTLRLPKSSNNSSCLLFIVVNSFFKATILSSLCFRFSSWLMLARFSSWNDEVILWSSFMRSEHFCSYVL